MHTHAIWKLLLALPAYSAIPDGMKRGVQVSPKFLNRPKIMYARHLCRCADHKKKMGASRVCSVDGQ